MADFKRSLAVVIGINGYQDYPKLQTARYDAERLAEILAIEHKYDYVILVADETYKEYLKGQELPVKNKYQPTLNGLRNLLGKRLPSEINPTKEDRLLFYFAGHGIPDNSDEGPKGYLVPLDADSKKRDSLLPMQDLYKYLAALNCRHFLVVLDCCFAGRFSWSSTRKGGTFPRVIHKEHYDRFINSPAWQAITSASHDQEAFDILGDNRGTIEGTNHSPFAEGLFKALQGEADVFPASKNGQPAGDGVITATELYLYLREHVEIGSKERQTPGLWSLPKHDRGEYIFLVPGAKPKLKHAPRVNEKNNPYRGLESFDEEHSQFFFGMEELIQQLSTRVSAPKQPLTVVLGVSGSGKSSLVKAGLIPYLKKLSKSEVFEVNLVSAYILTSAVVQAFTQVSPKFLPINYAHQWRILSPIRPGEQPFKALAKAILPLADVTDSNQPDTLNFLKVSDRLDTLTFFNEVLKQKLENLDEKVAESSHNNGEESSETLRLQKELDNFILIVKEWHQGTQKAKQLLIVEHEEELYTLCRNSAEKQQLQQAVSDCLEPLSLRLQSDPNQLIDIVRAWSKNNPGVKLLLTIDQLEELITLSQSKQKDKQNNQQQQQKKPSHQATQEVQQDNEQEEWQQFLSLLEKTLSANVEQLRIIVTLRSDFEPRFLNSDALKSYWTKARFPVRAMYPDELRQAIERPAAEMALYFQPSNLVDRLIGEVGQMPGALPLLSFTLSELYLKLAEKWRLQETSDRALILDADFDKEGGVAGSLTRRANKEYDDLLNDDKRATLRRVMLRMVTTEGGESARRRVPRSEFVYADDEENKRVEEVINRLVEARLIVSGQATGESYVEPAHDFLVRSWDKLQQWQQKEQRDLLLQRQLTPVANDWKGKEQSSSLLGKTEPFLDWCDKRIDSAEDWLNKIKKNVQERLREKKRQFLWNGNPYLDVLKNRLKDYDHWFNQVEAEFVQQSVWQRRRNVNTIRMGIALTLAVVTSFAFYFWYQLQISQIREKAGRAMILLETNDPVNGLLLAIEATGQNSSLSKLLPFQNILNPVQSSLFEAIYASRESYLLRHESSECGQNIARLNPPCFPNPINISLDGHKIKIFENPQIPISPDGHEVKWGAKVNTKAKFIDKLQHKLGDNYEDMQEDDLKISPDGKFIYSNGAATAAKSSSAFISDLDGNLVNPFNEKLESINSFIFSSDSSLIAISNIDGTIRLSDPLQNQLAVLRGHTREIEWLSFFEVSDNRYLASAGEDKTLRIWDLNNQRLEKIIDFNGEKSKDSNRSLTINITPDGKYFIIDGKIFDKQRNPINPIDFKKNFDGKYLIGSNGIGFWDLEYFQNKENKEDDSSSSRKIAVSSDRQYFLNTNKTVIEIKNNQGQKVGELNRRSKASVATFTHDGNRILVGYDSGEILLLDKQGKILKSFKQHQKPIDIINLSPNDQFFVSHATDETTGRLWSLNDDRIKIELQGHNEVLRTIVFSPDGQYIVTGSGKNKLAMTSERPYVSKENTIRLWDLQGNQIGTPFQGNNAETYDIFFGRSSPVTSIAFTSEGQSMISASENSYEVFVWRAGNWKNWLSVACNRLRYHPVLKDPQTEDAKGAKKTCEENVWNLPKQPGQKGEIIIGETTPVPTPTKSARNLRNNIPPSIPSPQTTIANSSAPANAPARPQNVPSPTPPSNNGQNNYRQAPSDRNQASKLNSTSVETYINQGLTYHRQGNYQQAISNYSQAIALNPNSVEAYSNRAVAYNEQKDYQKAITDSNKTISLNPNYANAYITRGLAYHRQGNFQQAIKDYNKAIELAPNNANAYNIRALVYTRLGNQQAAQADKQKAAAFSQRQSQ